jgi:hypothetical protein
MRKLMSVTAWATTASVTLFLAQPLEAGTAVVQPHRLLLDEGQGNTNPIQNVRWQVVGGAEEASRGDLVGGTQAGAAAVGAGAAAVGAGAAVGHVEAGAGVGVGAGAAVRGCMAVGRLRMAMATDLPVATVTTGTAMDVPTMAMDMERRSFLSGLGDSASGGSNTTPSARIQRAFPSTPSQSGPLGIRFCRFKISFAWLFCFARAPTSHKTAVNVER